MAVFPEAVECSRELLKFLFLHLFDKYSPLPWREGTKGKGTLSSSTYWAILYPYLQKEPKKGKNMGILWLVLFVLVWVALQAYILPKLGIST
jgi:hypothetical protein